MWLQRNLPTFLTPIEIQILSFIYWLVLCLQFTFLPPITVSKRVTHNFKIAFMLALMKGYLSKTFERFYAFSKGPLHACITTTTEII